MLSLTEIVYATRGKRYGSLPNTNVTGISTDTRTIKAGEVFFAIEGDKFDGHNFVKDAFKKGGIAAVVSKPVGINENIISVDNTITALGNLAKMYRRKKIHAKVIVVTGTNGKTTTKDMIAHILSENSSVTKAKGSFNNFIGLPLTLFEAGVDTNYVVLEIGTNKKGEVAKLGEIAMPDVAIITNISESHLEGLGNIENIVVEKFSLLMHLTKNGVAVLNFDDPFTAIMIQKIHNKFITFGTDKKSSIVASDIKYEDNKIKFNIDNIAFALDMNGRWNISNALAAIATVKVFGVKLEDASRMLATFTPPPMRMQKVVCNNVTFINDAYNSNPVSAKNAIEDFSSLKWQGRKIAIIGDMLELGKQSQKFHSEIGKLLSQKKDISIIVGIGNNSSDMLKEIGNSHTTYHFTCVEDAIKNINDIVKKEDIVLLKGSRKMRLEKIVDYFRGI